MVFSKWKCFAALAFFSCATFAYASTDTPSLPDDVYSAKSVALVFRIVGESARQEKAIAEYKVKLEAKAVAEIQKQKRFELVSDPAKADLVFVLIPYWGPYFREGKSVWNHTSTTLQLHPPQTLMVLRGGNYPQWIPAPLWLETLIPNRQSPSALAGLIKDFHKLIQKQQTAANTGAGTTGDASQKSENKPTNAAADSGGATGTKAGQTEPDRAADASAQPAAADNAGTEEKNASTEEKEGPEPKEEADVVKGPMLFCWSDFKNCHPAAPLYSAKTVFVFSMAASGFTKKESDKIKEWVQSGGRWSLADDPKQADLIMVLHDRWANDAYPGGLAGAMLGGANLSILYLLKGGSKPDWDSVLLFTTIGGGGLFSKVRPSERETVLDHLQKFLTETQPAAPNK